MKFRIRRTSSYCANEQPCEGAELVKEDDEKKIWHIEINSLEELLALSDREREQLIVWNGGEFSGEMPQIEIYDDYRE